MGSFKYSVRVSERFMVRWGFVKEYGESRFEIRLWSKRQDGSWAPTKKSLLMTADEGMEFLELSEQMLHEELAKRSES